MLDLLFAAIALLLLWPFMLLIALLIRLNSKGPALFRQKRVSKDCRIFTIYKFRSMRIETERNGQPLADFERLTRLGAFLRKTSLDELPQLINILCGHMSFVGPRPLLPEYISRYSPFQMRRHEVLPGITGFAQVNGRNALSWEKKFEYDVFYVDHIGFFFDIKILFLTVRAVFSAKDVNQSAEDTMSAFMGSGDHNEPG